METVLSTDRQQRFTALAHDVGPALRRYVVRRTDPDSVDDVLADTLLVLWRRLDDVPADEPLPWCYGVARGCLANAHRAARRRDRLTDRLATVRTDQPPDDTDLHEALERLSDQERELVRLWAWEQLQPHEIATVLEITPNAVSIRLHRARRKLAELLDEVRKTSAPAGQEQGDERRSG
ncbi:MAG TPA: sigma-70 family RNA polymerase sigma factor [Nocardioidaceae bacterium]|nr:sigma-70 family RNA polymerase sigma factor [Nocardioidaceae bacterium]